MRRYLLYCIGLLVIGFGTAGCADETSEPTSSSDTPEVTAAVDSLAEAILDTTRTDEQRQTIIQDHPDEAVALVKAMTDDLSPGTQEEYDRIPWIWRVSIALGERNDSDEIRRLLAVSLPEEGEPFREWQSVVVGGGIVNGISRQNDWPKQRIEDIIAGDRTLTARWERTIELSSKMADNREVANPYRYDALRIIAMQSWEEASDQLIEYLSGEVDSELQMGAVSGLSDVRSPRVAEVLIDHVGEYSTDRNRSLAMDALMRTDERKMALLDAVSRGRVPAEMLGAERIERLQNASNTEIQERAREVFRR